MSEHFPEPCAVGGHGPVWCAECGKRWPCATAMPEFLGSVTLINALYETYSAHVGITEPDGPHGPYIWCACGWRSDDLPFTGEHGDSYAVHLTNALHAASVKALQEVDVVRRSDALRAVQAMAGALDA